jgi:hypothetical protein
MHPSVATNNFFYVPVIVYAQYSLVEGVFGILKVECRCCAVGLCNRCLEGALTVVGTEKILLVGIGLSLQNLEGLKARVIKFFNSTVYP